jgi:hypothetical protein
MYTYNSKIPVVKLMELKNSKHIQLRAGHHQLWAKTMPRRFSRILGSPELANQKGERVVA